MPFDPQPLLSDISPVPPCVLFAADHSPLTAEAIQDENQGLVYSARIKLSQDKLQIKNRWVRLSPGGGGR